MSLMDGPVKDAWDGLSAAARHTISLVVVGAMLTGMFFVFIRDPLSAATEADARQDNSIAQHAQRLDQMQQTLADISRTQAVQTNTIANMQDSQHDTKLSLDAINRKLDRLMEKRWP